MAYVYVVRGSEDGNVGAYSSRKKATKAATKYVVDAIGDDTDGIDIQVLGWFTYIRANHSNISAEVEKFVVR